MLKVVLQARRLRQKDHKLKAHLGYTVRQTEERNVLRFQAASPSVAVTVVGVVGSPALGSTHPC